MHHVYGSPANSHTFLVTVRGSSHSRIKHKLPTMWKKNLKLY